jgi:hypothetical protein
MAELPVLTDEVLLHSFHHLRVLAPIFHPLPATAQVMVIQIRLRSPAGESTTPPDIFQ